MRRQTFRLALSAFALSVLALAFFGASAEQPSSKPVMTLKVDHASVCGSALDPLRQAFASIGLPTDYGGPHANGVTHMALLGFEDGSYLELIAPMKSTVHASGMMSGWDKLMGGDAGPCAWAIGTNNIHAEVERLKSAGIKTTGPEPGGRKKPDGTQISWETASVGAGAPGATLPFMIEDKTARALRVQPSAGLKGSGLTGIAVVILGVRDLNSATSLFQKAYGWPAPQIAEQKDFAARIAYFPGTPVMLAAPLDKAPWLAERLDKFGESPVAYLLGTSDFALATTKFHLTNSSQWFGRNVAWFDQKKLLGMRIGVIQ
jgi:Glyoxalase-like domain